MRHNFLHNNDIFYVCKIWWRCILFFTVYFYVTLPNRFRFASHKWELVGLKHRVNQLLSSLLQLTYILVGIWYISIVAQCYNSSSHTSNNTIDCDGTMYADVNIGLRPCLNKTCGEYGQCRNYYSGVIHWSVCRCKAGKLWCQIVMDDLDLIGDCLKI